MISKTFFDRYPVDEYAAKFSGADPSPHLLLEEVLDEESFKTLAGKFPKFGNKPASGSGNSVGKSHISNMQKLPEFVKLRDAMNSPEMCSFLAGVSGFKEIVSDGSLHGAGVHCMAPQGYLMPHADFNKKGSLFRVMNIILFLNEEWRPEWGGECELWSSDMTRVVSNPVKGNTAVLFLTNDNTPHAAKINTGPEPRNTFATYYYVKEKPDFFTTPHSTIFKQRPDGSK